MKKIYYLLLAILVLGSVACSDLTEEVLDEQNGSAIV